jgi:serine phosphatase RsbU (regulator of sigma subunit)/anti-sigma regulatory factor (Ser/Thr protein kinase)
VGERNPGTPTGHGEVWLDEQALVDFFEQRPQFAFALEGPEFRFVATNRALRELAGGRPLLGVPVFEAFKELASQGVAELYQRVYETGVPELGREWAVHLQHPDGSTQVLWSNHSVMPWRDADGKVVGIWSESEDVTAQVEARLAMEAELRSLTAQFEQAREVIDTMQRALLPDRVPVLPTLDIAGRYLLAADEQAAGGDWFDVVVRRGHALLVVGDVVGHGLTASAAMGQLRAVLLDRLSTEASIADAVAAVDRRARRDPASFGATVCVVDVDLSTGELEYVTAGHPPPLVLDGAPEPGPGNGAGGASARVSDWDQPGESARFLEPSGAGALGAAGEILVARDQLDDHQVVVLYTDGIVERPNRTPAQGTAELARDAHRAIHNTLMPIDAPGLAVERITSHVIQTLTRSSGYRDDITLVAAQRTRRRPPLYVRLPADSSAVATARHVLLGWLDERGARRSDIDAVIHAVTELVENVVDHAYADRGTEGAEGADAPGPPGEASQRGHFEIVAALRDDGSATLTVRDQGRWIARAARASRGLGLALVRGIVDELEIDHGDEGTTVTVRHHLTRHAGVLVPSGSGGRRPDPELTVFDIWQHELDDGGISVGARGVLDARAVPELKAHLSAATAPGLPAATLDLRDVTVLSSAVVHLLLRVLTDHDRLRIIAPAGTVAQHVLCLARVPHTTIH